MYEDSQPCICIDVLEANTVTGRVKHIAVPIHYIPEQIHAGPFIMRKIGTHLNPLDSDTKPNPVPTHFRHYEYTTVIRFHLPQESEHYNLIELDTVLKYPYSKAA